VVFKPDVVTTELIESYGYLQTDLIKAWLTFLPKDFKNSGGSSA